MESFSSILSLIPEMIPTTEQAFELGFKSGSLYLASFASLIMGKIFRQPTLVIWKLKAGISDYTYIPALILRPWAYVSPHFTFLSPLYLFHPRLHLSAQMPLYRENWAKYPMGHPTPLPPLLYIPSLCFFW